MFVFGLLNPNFRFATSKSLFCGLLPYYFHIRCVFYTMIISIITKNSLLIKIRESLIELQPNFRLMAITLLQSVQIKHSNHKNYSSP